MIFFTFFLNSWGLWQRKFLQGKLCHSEKLGEVTCHLIPTKDSMGTGTDFWELISILLPRPTQGKKSKYSNNAFLISSSAGKPIGAGMSQQNLVNGHCTAH